MYEKEEEKDDNTMKVREGAEENVQNHLVEENEDILDEKKKVWLFHGYWSALRIDNLISSSS